MLWATKGTVTQIVQFGNLNFRAINLSVPISNNVMHRSKKMTFLYAYFRQNKSFSVKVLKQYKRAVLTYISGHFYAND